MAMDSEKSALLESVVSEDSNGGVDVVGSGDGIIVIGRSSNLSENGSNCVVRIIRSMRMKDYIFAVLILLALAISFYIMFK
jgi:hypothetical protein